MVLKNKNTKSYFQNGILWVGIISFMLCIGQTVLPSSSENSMPINADQGTRILTLKVSSIFPQDGAVLTNFPANFEIKVTRGGFPEQDARVQFWMIGGPHDPGAHNAFLTFTDSSGFAHLTLRNKNTLDPGLYIWHADAMKPGFRAGTSDTISFVIPPTVNKGISTTNGGTVSTDQKEYSVGKGNGESIVIHGSVNNYWLGQPIILKITSPDGKIVQLVTYGTYLGEFQTVYKLGQDSKLGPYTMTVYHNFVLSSTGSFYVVK
jgi:hypothetical protein